MNGIRSRIVTALKAALAGAVIAGAMLVPAARADRILFDTDAIAGAQKQLLAQELEGFAPRQPGGPDLYFIGFAGYSGQDVFLKEVETVQKLFDERFGTKGRSLLLVNNLQTIDALPLATGRMLERALEGVAAKMDVDKDVLFLFLTSHGAPKQLAVSFPPLRLENLSPETLRRMLDAAGIRWRVIVISACYSGSFIDALKDKRTLLITAAARDRSSFGCSSENDFTYFGDAYFNQALRRDTSFIAAFEDARRIIAAREREEGLTPSKPQIFLGAAMKRKLGELPQQLSHDAGVGK